MKLLIILSLLAVTATSSNAGNGRQLVAPLDARPPYRRIDGPDVVSINQIPDELQDKLEPEEEEMGILDSLLGDGAQSRLVESVNNWVVDKAKENPGCVERFVCETYRTGSTMSGVPYFLMSLSNAAVSFMVAEMFDQSIDVNDITRAARYGRTVGTCHNMNCEFLDNQLRTVGDYLGTFEDFLTSIISSISNSISFGKK